MKKRNLKSLKLRKESISNLNDDAIKGGAGTSNVATNCCFDTDASASCAQTFCNTLCQDNCYPETFITC